MGTKVVLQFELQTVAAGAQPDIGYAGTAHTTGWTENVWSLSNDFNLIANVLKQNNGLAKKRAALLPSQSSLTRAKLYADGSGKGFVVPLNMPGGSGDTDQANLALLCGTNNASAAVQRHWWIHNIPDVYIKKGEFVPTPFYAAGVAGYFTALGDYYWKGLLQVNPTKIVKIDATGLVTLASPSSWGVGAQVRITRTTDALGRRHGGNFEVKTTGPLSINLTLANWPYGDCTGGTAYTRDSEFYLISGNGAARPTVERIGTKRVGRPSDLYRGRRSARR